MPIWRRATRAGLVTGLYASVASTAALAAAARAEGVAPLQPLNATSHWRHGPSAARVRGLDLSHTGVGYATHHVACVFWAVLFEAWLGWRRTTRTPAIWRDAGLAAVVAAAVDYGPTPKRFTPGWEFVLSKGGMAFAYAGLAVGLAAGALRSRER